MSDPREGYTIGLDIGGTTTRAGIVEFPSGRIVEKRVRPTNAHRGGEALLAATLEYTRNLFEFARNRGITIDAIGIGLAELVDLQGNVTSGQTIAWKGLSVRTAFNAIAPSILDSDVRTAARAEASLGAGRGRTSFVYVTVGTGISSCLVLGGVPYAGARGNALILASSPQTAVCEGCGSISRRILENYASGPGLAQRFSAATGRLITGAEEVLAACAAGHEAAREIIRTGAEALGVAVAWQVNTLDPESVVIGGGLGLAGGIYWSAFADAMRAHVWAEGTRGIDLARAELGADAGLIGAALMAHMHTQ